MCGFRYMKKETRFFIDSNYVKGIGWDAVVVKEKVAIEADDGSVSWKDDLSVIDSPKRPVWITKRRYQTHTQKKQFEEQSKLDRYDVYNYELAERLAHLLGKDTSSMRFKPSVKFLSSSPYVYGADVGIEALIKRTYNRKTENSPHRAHIPYTHGVIDIETHIEQNVIGAITFIHEQDVFLGLHSAYMYELDESTDKRFPVDEEYVRNTVESSLDEFFQTYGPRLKRKFLKNHGHLFNENGAIPLNLHIHVAKDEVDLISWIYSSVHKMKTDFIAFWNMHYDISKMIERLLYHGADPKKVFCPSVLKEEYRLAEYKEDVSKSKQKAHIADKWHAFNCTGYSRHYDQMCLYGRARRGQGRDNKISLDYIAKKELGVGKYSFGARGLLGFCDVWTRDSHGHFVKRCTKEELESGAVIDENGNRVKSSYSINIPLVNAETGDVVVSMDDIYTGLLDEDEEPLDPPEASHTEMITNRFPEYAAYNVIDCLLVQLMYWKNKDIIRILPQLGTSNLSDLDKQSVLLKNNFYDEMLLDGVLPASAGKVKISENDKKMGRAGGTVLPSVNTKNVGLYCIKELCTKESLARCSVYDIDAGSMYPTFIEVCNISQETKVSTVISIDGVQDNMEFENIFHAAASPIENAVPVCSRYFGLPSYSELISQFAIKKSQGEI